jgi:putative tricarboxylic transport membrane protein
VAMMARGALALRRAKAPAAAAAEDAEAAAGLPRALGFLAIGAGYVVILPYAGYALSIALLIAAVALYEGARRDWRIPATAVFGGVLFWLLFDKLLGVSPPPGILF